MTTTRNSSHRMTLPPPLLPRETIDHARYKSTLTTLHLGKHTHTNLPVVLATVDVVVVVVVLALAVCLLAVGT